MKDPYLQFLILTDVALWLATCAVGIVMGFTLAQTLTLPSVVVAAYNVMLSAINMSKIR